MILINLNDAKVESNSWSEEKIIDNTKYAGINGLVGEGQRNIKTIEKNLSRIELEIPYKGSSVNYKELIQMDNKTLLMKLAVQKTSYAYIDKQDANNIYVDLEFLNA